MSSEINAIVARIEKCRILYKPVAIVNIDFQRNSIQKHSDLDIFWRNIQLLSTFLETLNFLQRLI